MADRVPQDVLDNKIAHLRLKHRSADGSVDMTPGSDFHQDLVAWLEDQDLALNFERMATQAAASYYDRHKSYQNIARLEEETGSLFEDDALVSLSLDKAEHIEMGELKRPLHRRHHHVLVTQITRQLTAAQKIIGYTNEWLDNYLDDEEKLREVEKRIARPRRKKRRDDLDQAAD